MTAAARTRAATAAGRRLRDEPDHTRLRIARQPGQRLERREPVHRLVEIPSARADALRDAPAEPMDETRDLLKARPGRGDQPDVSTPHPVREAEAHAIDEARPALRTHHEEPTGRRALLERDLVGQRDAVAEQEHVEARGERLVGLGRGMGAGHRDERHVRPGQPPRRAGDRAGWLAPVRALVPPARGEERLGLAERGVGRLRALGTDHDDEVGEPGPLGLRGQEVGLVEHPPVQLGRHHQGGRPDPRERPDALRDLHERHRVDEGVGPDSAARHHGRPAVASSSTEAARRNPTIQSVPDEDPTASAPRTAASSPRGSAASRSATNRVIGSRSSPRRACSSQIRPSGDAPRAAPATTAAVTRARARAITRRGRRRPGSRLQRSRRGDRPPPASARGRAPPGRGRPAPRDRRVAADRRIAQEPGRGRRDPGNPRSEPTARGSYAQRSGSRHCPAPSATTVARVPHPVGQVPRRPPGGRRGAAPRSTPPRARRASRRPGRTSALAPSADHLAHAEPLVLAA